MDGLRAAVVAVLCLAGCRQQPQALVVDVRGPDGSPAVSLAPTEITQSKISYSIQVLGAAPYDGFTLPLVSPDGSMVAVQSVNNGDWNQILARGKIGSTCQATIKVYPLGQPDMRPETDVVGESLLLGRSADARGFLVESPQENGSRWIGRAPWTGGTPAWIVADENVNAFACLGPSGLVAWCKRERTSAVWSMALGRMQGSSMELLVEIPPPTYGTWIAPSLSADGETLFALRLHDGVLALAAFPISATLPKAPRITVDISWRADERTAFQSIVPLRVTPPDDGRLAFFHPRFSRVSYWDDRNNSIGMTAPGVSSAVAIGPAQLLTSTGYRLAIEPVPAGSTAGSEENAITVIDADWIPLGVDQRRCVIVARPERGQLALAKILLVDTPR